MMTFSTIRSAKYSMRRYWPIFALCAALALTACSSDDTASASPSKKGGGQRGGNFGVVTVETTLLNPTTVRVEGDYAGEFVAESVAHLSADTAGRLIEVNAHIGDAVEKGDVLAAIDALPFEQRVREAQAAVQMAQANIRETTVQRDNIEADLARKRPLRDRQMIAEREIEDLEANLASANQRIAVAEATLAQNRARLLTAQEDLRNTKIIAPFDGYIADRMFDPGTYISPNQTVFRLISLDDLYLTVRIPEQDAGQITAQMPVTLRVAALGGQLFNGSIKRVAPSLDGATRTLRIDISVDENQALIDNPLLIKPGMFARAQIELGEAPNALAVPNQALLQESDGAPFVWIVDGDKKAQKQPIQLGLAGRKQTQVTSGIEPNTEVVIRGQDKLRPDVNVLIIEGTSAGDTTKESL